MNRNDFIDNEKFKEKLEHPNVAIGQKWRALHQHDFGHGFRAYIIRIITKEPFGDKWIANFYLESGGQIPNGYSNNYGITEEQIKDNFEFIPNIIPNQTDLSLIGVSGTIFTNANMNWGSPYE